MYIKKKGGGCGRSPLFKAESPKMLKGDGLVGVCVHCTLYVIDSRKKKKNKSTTPSFPNRTPSISISSAPWSQMRRKCPCTSNLQLLGRKRL